jgi:hypothetical protein
MGRQNRGIEMKNAILRLKLADVFVSAERKNTSGLEEFQSKLRELIGKAEAFIKKKKLETKRLDDVYCEKLEIANRDTYMKQFIFEFEGEYYFVKWGQLKWSEPIKIKTI